MLSMSLNQDEIGNQQYSYVYYTQESHSGRFYIGSRRCPIGIKPNQDTEYKGSFTDVTFSPDSKFIVYISVVEYLVRMQERNLIKCFFYHPLMVNKCITPIVDYQKLHYDPVINFKRKEGLKNFWETISDEKFKEISEANPNKNVGLPYFGGKGLSDEHREKLREKWVKNNPMYDPEHYKMVNKQTYFNDYPERE